MVVKGLVGTPSQVIERLREQVGVRQGHCVDLWTTQAQSNNTPDKMPGEE